MKHRNDLPRFLQQAHERWLGCTNRDLSRVDPPDDWVWNQCESCRYWLPLDRRLTTDWGVCSNQHAQSDRLARFAHDGCEHFAHFGEDAEETST